MTSEREIAPAGEVASKFVVVDGIRTHYLEAGTGPNLVLIQSGEYGASAELSWERNIGALARHFRVLAPDIIGYGETDKLFDFVFMRERREQHVARFLAALGIERAHFAGNSMGANMVLTAALRPESGWPIDKMIVIAGGGEVPDGEARAILTDYDCTREHMKRILGLLFISPEFRDDEAYLERRYRSSLIPGAWECAAAARFRSPARAPAGPRITPDYSKIARPTLIVTGDRDPLKRPDYGTVLQSQIPGSRLEVVANAGHCPHIEYPDQFNKLAVTFLTG